MLSFAQYIRVMVENYAPEGYNLQHKFAYYNSKLFENRIPHDTPVMWSALKGQMGLTSYEHIGGQKMVPGTLKIELSTRFRRSEHDNDATLIHEMIHAYLAVTSGDGDVAHGRRFQTMVLLARHKTGINVSMKSTSIADLQMVDDSAPLSTVLLMKRAGSTWYTIYRGTPFDDHKQQNALAAFWGIPGRMQVGSSIDVVKVETSVGEKYGYTKGLIQDKWKEMSATELKKILQHGQVIYTVHAGSVSHEHSLEHLPSKEALVLLQQNRAGSYLATFYYPNIAQELITAKLDKNHRPGSEPVELLRVNSPVVTQGKYVLGRGMKGTYYKLAPDKVAALLRGSTSLRKWI